MPPSRSMPIQSRRQARPARREVSGHGNQNLLGECRGRALEPLVLELPRIVNLCRLEISQRLCGIRASHCTPP